MSVFTNPSDSAAEVAEAYIAAVLDLVNDQDPMHVLQETPDFVAAAIHTTSAPALQVPEAPGKWSMAAVVLHLADSEIVWAWRLRLVLAEDEPTLTGYDQDLWAKHLGYGEVDAQEALSTFVALRRSNLRLLQSAPPEALEREGKHVERGRESVAHMIRLYAGHDLAHRNQLERIRATISGHPG